MTIDDRQRPARFGIRLVMDPLTLNPPEPGPAVFFSLSAPPGMIVARANEISAQSQGYGGSAVDSDDQVAGWTKVTDAIHAKHGDVILQLWHRGQADGEMGDVPALIERLTRAFGTEFNKVDSRRAHGHESVEDRARQLLAVAQECAKETNSDCLGVLIAPVSANCDNPESNEMP